MRELLVYVTCEPDFQVNDYREMIFLYGFYHHLSYAKCLTMVDKFESSLPLEFSLKQQNRTNNIWKEYGKNCELAADDFLQWMLERVEDFKGYSKTVLDYFKTIKEEVIHEIKKDAKDYLETLLAETSFERWEQKWHMNTKNRKKTIPKYLKSIYCNKNDNLSEQMKRRFMSWWKFQIFLQTRIRNFWLNCIRI